MPKSVRSLVSILVVLGTQPLLAQITHVDSAGNVGRESSVTIGSDGLPLISYVEYIGSTIIRLKVAHCNDLACSSPATKTTLDGDQVNFTSIALGGDGLGLVAYNNGGLKVAHCENVSCTIATTTPLDSGVVYSPDLAIGGDGLGLISYFDSAEGYLKVAHCDNVACTSATVTPLVVAPSSSGYASIAIGTDGFGLIAYQLHSGSPVADGTLKVAHCSNANCTSAVSNTVDSFSQAGEYVGQYTAIAIGSDGFGLISYQYQRTGNPEEIRVAHCSNADCSVSIKKTLESAPETGVQTSIAIGSDGFGLVTYLHPGGANRDLRFARCSDLVCSAATFMTVDGPDNVGWFSSIAIGQDKLPIISYSDETNFDLKVAHCLDPHCDAEGPATGYYTIAPCRVLDTRNSNGPLGGPPLGAQTNRTFRVGSVCGIPSTAKSIAVNMAVTTPTTIGNLRLRPAGIPVPLIASINYGPGQTRTNNAIVPLSALGEFEAYCAQASGSVHFILDVNGYFE